MIIAVDFDGTLQCRNKEPNTILIQSLKQNQANGDCVILWTCREGKSLAEAVGFLRENGFVPNLINENHPEIVRRQGYNSRKIFADVYIDDRNV